MVVSARATGGVTPLRLEMADDQPVHGIRFLPLKCMPGAGDDLDIQLFDAQPGPVDHLPILDADFVVPEHQQDRSIDAFELLVGELPVLDELQFGAAYHLRKVVRVLRVDVCSRT